jgi:broad specificity phosphatase PhoE
VTRGRGEREARDKTALKGGGRAKRANSLVHARCFALGEPRARELAAQPRARAVHFIRHGEAEHQRAAARAAERGLTCRCEDAERRGVRADACPYFDAAMVDAPLTELGRAQVAGAGEGCGAEVVLAAASARTLETARLAFRAPAPPILALEELRARVGPHTHSRRSARADLMARFPEIDFSRVTDDEDRLWTRDPEPRARLDARAARALELVLARPERSIAVVTHFTLFLALFMPASRTLLIGTNPERAGDDPALLDVRASERADELASFVEIGRTRSVLLVPA